MKVGNLILLTAFSILIVTIAGMADIMVFSSSKTANVEPKENPCLKYAKLKNQTGYYDKFIFCIGKQNNIEFSKDKTYQITIRKEKISSVDINYWVVIEQEETINEYRHRRRSWWFEASTLVYLGERDLWRIC